MRVLAIGDIHGCYDALRTLVKFVGVESDDTVVTLGDYVDRGPETRAVIEWLIQFSQSHRLVPLRGNHEIMMLNARLGVEAKRSWGQFGASATLDSYASPEVESADLEDVPERHWQFLSNLLPFYETETHLFVHASVDPTREMEQQPEETLFWSQYHDGFPGHCSGKTLVCGHKSQASGLPAFNDHAVCIDTGACKGGWLTCLDPLENWIWQANQSGETRSMSLRACV